MGTGGVIQTYTRMMRPKSLSRNGLTVISGALNSRDKKA